MLAVRIPDSLSYHNDRLLLSQWSSKQWVSVWGLASLAWPRGSFDLIQLLQNRTVIQDSVGSRHWLDRCQVIVSGVVSGRIGLYVFHYLRQEIGLDL